MTPKEIEVFEHLHQVQRKLTGAVGYFFDDDGGGEMGLISFGAEAHIDLDAVLENAEGHVAMARMKLRHLVQHGVPKVPPLCGHRAMA